MKRFFLRQSGMALPLVLSVLMIGGLTLAPLLAHANTNLRGGQAIKSNLRGVYAADAGVEQVIWSLQRSETPPATLAGGLNGASVNMTTEDMGLHTLYMGQLIEADSHMYYLAVDGVVTWDAGADKYRYTITVTLMGGSSSVHIVSIGARMPDGYAYETGSAAGFPTNLATAEPDLSLDSSGNQLANWQFAEPYPQVTKQNPSATQDFYVSGAGAVQNYYSWVVANREDVGEVSEVTGEMFRVTATATDSYTGRVLAVITASLIRLNPTTVKVVDWKIGY